MKRYGLIGTCYNTGISHIASGFAEQLDMKALLVDHKPFAKFPNRFKNHRLTPQISPQDIDWLLDGIDVLFTIETPYEWRIYELAHKRGIKTVLMPMIEWLDRSQPELRNVDLFLCPSEYTARLLPSSANKIVVPCEVPVDLSKFKKREITHPKVFLHNAGHGGVGGRNSTQELMKAIPLVQSDVRFIIRSQFQLPNKVEDPRVTYAEGNVENYWDLYAEGDIWIMPWKYGVAALGLQESMAAGMVPMITNMEPFDSFMPAELLITPQSLKMKTMRAGQKELYAEQDPTFIAMKIDEMAKTDPYEFKVLVKWAEMKAQEWSWDTWRPKYQAIFDAL